MGFDHYFGAFSVFLFTNLQCYSVKQSLSWLYPSVGAPFLLHVLCYSTDVAKLISSGCFGKKNVCSSLGKGLFLFLLLKFFPFASLLCLRARSLTLTHVYTLAHNLSPQSSESVVGRQIIDTSSKPLAVCRTMGHIKNTDS